MLLVATIHIPLENKLMLVGLWRQVSCKQRVYCCPVVIENPAVIALVEGPNRFGRAAADDKAAVIVHIENQPSGLVEEVK